MDWMRFLRGTPAGDYVYQEAPYEEQVRRAADLLDQADAVLIGAGAGLSAAAGLVYGGRRFTDNFSEFIGRYGPRCHEGYVRGRLLSISDTGGTMGLLVKACLCEPD